MLTKVIFPDEENKFLAEENQYGCAEDSTFRPILYNEDTGQKFRISQKFIFRFVIIGLLIEKQKDDSELVFSHDGKIVAVKAGYLVIKKKDASDNK